MLTHLCLGIMLWALSWPGKNLKDIAKAGINGSARTIKSPKIDAIGFMPVLVSDMVKVSSF